MTFSCFFIPFTWQLVTKMSLIRLKNKIITYCIHLMVNFPCLYEGIEAEGIFLHSKSSRMLYIRMVEHITRNTYTSYMYFSLYFKPNLVNTCITADNNWNLVLNTCCYVIKLCDLFMDGKLMSSWKKISRIITLIQTGLFWSTHPKGKPMYFHTHA